MDVGHATELGRGSADTDAALPPGGATAPAEPRPPGAQAAPSWVAQALIPAAAAAGDAGLIYAASSERRAEEIGRALRRFAPELEVLVLPPWDCLPYDRASPSREVMGRRMAVLARLAEPAEQPRVLVTSVEALVQRTPPAKVLADAFRRLAVGEVLDRAALQAFASATGYLFDDRIDEPGEIAILGSVVDIFPAAADTPVRISLADDDRILEIKLYDPLSQRTDEAIDAVLLGPASELVLADPEAERAPGAEHRAPEVYGKMPALLDLMPAAAIAQDPRAEARAGEFVEQVAEAFEARVSLDGKEIERPLPADRLYLTAQAYRGAVRKRTAVELDPGRVLGIPNFARDRNPGRAFSDFVAGRLEAGSRVILTGLAHELRPLARALKRGLDRAPVAVDSWAQAVGSDGAGLVALDADLDTGFEDPDARLVVVAAGDVLGGRLAARGGGATGAAALAEPDLRLGDVVIHEDHGVGLLKALERIEVDGVERDAVRLEYHGGADLLVPVEEFGKIWRYGAEPEAVSFDRLHTDAWSRRRAELSQEIDRTAEHLVALAKARSETRGAILEPPAAAYARFAAGFPYPETPDQAAAIAAVLADLASGQVMSRLVCGDVGFGKTEVALRAAAAVALSGKQVAVVAPTTVLARQHHENFRRRLAGFGVAVGRLSRLVSPAEAKGVKQGLADGSIGVVVGTHALASADVAFKDLGLLIIDEEQRFGAKLKAQLRDLAPNAHLLTMTATPIPRTLQLAMVGVEDVSVIATPPARRRPIRTFLAAYDAATVRTALLRERRRGGQSFVVAPRIEDMGPLAEELGRLVPELTIRMAHGGLAPDEVDTVMVGFAAGEGDVLLATNIIESGLDVPRANTMLVTRADLFGLAQLHQLRGRVGRGRAQGVAYLFHAADQELPDATRARLSTLEAFDRLGAGLAISARDLDLRGAGDLVGDEQAGHVKLIGTSLYQRLLTRAVRVAKGEIHGPDWTPQLNIGLTGALPDAYVPDPTVRINLYTRLARLGGPEEVQSFADELEDRFGPPPPECEQLLDLARVQAWAVTAGIMRIDAGPKALAFTPVPGSDLGALAARGGLEPAGERLVWRHAADAEPAGCAQILQILERLAG